MCTRIKKYNVIIGNYAKNHYIKPFKKKHKNAWDETWVFIAFVATQVEKFFTSSIATKIFEVEGKYIAKCEFTIAGSNKSHKTSGNRFILFVDEELLESTILLVYAKTDIKGGNETTWWKAEIKENYKEIYNFFNF